MVSIINLFYIITTTLSSFILFICAFRHYKNIEQHKTKFIKIKKFIVSHKIHPIIEITNEELKDEFVEYETRKPTIVGEENI
jgi:hypothetical protein